MSAQVFAISDLSVRYPDGAYGLTGLTLDVFAGERLALLGANGSGKTTLLRAMIGLAAPTTGRIGLLGEELRSCEDAVRAHVGLVFQNPDAQLLSASVYEDVSFGPLNQNLAEKDVRARVEAALEAVGMLDRADASVQTLSFGQKKRVCIAGVLAMRPRVLLLDEPTEGLDPGSRVGFLGILEELHLHGLAIVMATHDVDLAYGWADRIAVMDRGKLAGAFDLHAQDGGEVARAIGMPLVAEVYGALVRSGLLAPVARAPRTREDLVALLDAHARRRGIA